MYVYTYIHQKCTLPLTSVGLAQARPILWQEEVSLGFTPCPTQMYITLNINVRLVHSSKYTLLECTKPYPHIDITEGLRENEAKINLRPTGCTTEVHALCACLVQQATCIYPSGALGLTSGLTSIYVFVDSVMKTF